MKRGSLAGGGGGWGREGFATDIRGTENGQAVSTSESSAHVSVSLGHERLDPAQPCTLVSCASFGEAGLSA